LIRLSLSVEIAVAEFDTHCSTPSCRVDLATNGSQGFGFRERL